MEKETNPVEAAVHFVHFSISIEPDIYFGRNSRPIYINLWVNDLSHSMIRYPENERKVDRVSLLVRTGIRTMDLLDRSRERERSNLCTNCTN